MADQPIPSKVSRIAASNSTGHPGQVERIPPADLARNEALPPEV
jgi:hypothetical protein